MSIIQSISIFVLAGLFEIGGGYLVWLFVKENKPLWVGLLGAVVLVLYGVVATMQPANFGRVYAAYGGVFIVMAVVWGWKVDNVVPDKYDLIGSAIAIIGMCTIFFGPRK